MDVIIKAQQLLGKASPNRAKDLEECIAETDRGVLRVYVAGPDKAGKSTTVNVLLRKPAARTAVRPVPIEGGFAVYPYGDDLLCDTIGYMADRTAAAPEVIKAMLGRAAIAVMQIHPESIGPPDVAIVRHLEAVGVPFAFVVNRMDAVPDAQAFARDFAVAFDRDVGRFKQLDSMHFTCMADAIEQLEACHWAASARLPAAVEAVEKVIRQHLKDKRKQAQSVVRRRTREHLLAVSAGVDTDRPSRHLRRLQAVQELDLNKRAWLAARLDRHIADIMATFDKQATALTQAIDAASEATATSAATSLKGFATVAPAMLLDLLATDLESAVRDIAHQVQLLGEEIGADAPRQAGAGTAARPPDTSSAAADAATAAQSATEAAQAALRDLARLATAIRSSLLKGAGGFALIEAGEEVGKKLLEHGGVELAARGGEVVGKVVESSVEQIGNALQAAAIVLAVAAVIHNLHAQREKALAAKKDVEAKLATARLEWRAALLRQGHEAIRVALTGFDTTLSKIAKDFMEDLKASEHLRDEAATLAAALAP